MAKKHIISVNFDIPHEDIETVRYHEKKSLADGDFIIFNPSIPKYYTGLEHQGKTLLDEKQSLQLLESFKHWKRELHTVIKSGKSIIIILTVPNSYFMALD